MNRNFSIGTLLVLFGVLVFLFTRPDATATRASGTAIAVVDSVTGSASFKNSQDEILPLQAQQKILENVTLTTDQNSGAIFHVNSGAKFEMAPLTKIVFEKTENVSMTVLEGQVQLISEDDHGFEVTKHGQTLSLAELKTPIDKLKLPEPAQIQTAPQTEPQATPMAVAATTTKPAPIAKHGTSLGQEDINKVMRNQTSFLHRCYINYMLRSQKLDLSGQVVLSFVIQPDGKVNSAKVISSPTHDDLLDRCLTDVVSRATFKEFKSEPILVQAYPIHLD